MEFPIHAVVLFVLNYGDLAMPNALSQAETKIVKQNQRREYRIQQCIEKLWGYVRENQNSLSSEVCHKKIRDVAELVAKDDAESLTNLTRHVEKQNALIRTMRAKMQQKKAVK